MSRSTQCRSTVGAIAGALLVAACSAVLTAAPDPTPVGTWRQFDDRKGDLRSIIRIEQVGEELVGTIEQTFLRPNEPERPTCDVCPGEFKDKPIVGLRFLWGLKGNGRQWGGGRVLDPEDGKIYRVKLTLSDDGRKLEVRGYVGLSMFGRSQTWVRAEP
jgi:uncharacterized protein (DUF2147 family)